MLIGARQPILIKNSKKGGGNRRPRPHFGLRRPVNVHDGLAFLFYPHQGFACLLWYLYTLFVIFGVMGLLDLWRTPLWGRVVLAVFVRFIPLPPYFCLDLTGLA